MSVEDPNSRAATAGSALPSRDSSVSLDTTITRPWGLRPVVVAVRRGVGSSAKVSPGVWKPPCLVPRDPGTGSTPPLPPKPPICWARLDRPKSCLGPPLGRGGRVSTCPSGVLSSEDSSEDPGRTPDKAWVAWRSSNLTVLLADDSGVSSTTTFSSRAAVALSSCSRWPLRGCCDVRVLFISKFSLSNLLWVGSIGASALTDWPPVNFTRELLTNPTQWTPPPSSVGVS